MVPFILIWTIHLHSANSESDIKSIKLEDFQPSGQDYGLGDVSDMKKLTLTLDDSVTDAFVAPKGSLFNKKVSVEHCSGGRCSDVPKQRVEKAVKDCLYLGKLAKDKDSRILMDKCSKGQVDLSIVSDKAQLSVNNYRQLANGTIRMADAVNYKDSKTAKQDLAQQNAVETRDLISHGEAYIDKEGQVISMKHEPSSDYTDEAGNCCRALAKQCTPGTDGKMKCRKKQGARMCGEACTKLEAKIKTNAEKSLRLLNTKVKTGLPGEGEDYAEQLPELVLGEIRQILHSTEKYRPSAAADPTCTAEAAKLPPGEFKECRQKRLNPKKKLYKQRTIEVGIVVDMFLWNNMKKAVLAEDPSAEEEKVMDNLLTMINSLMANAENFLLHGSLSNRGGFSVAINGIKVFKDDKNPLVKKMFRAETTDSLLFAFADYGLEVNEVYDGYDKSYDIMILLTGKQLTDVPPADRKGLAYYNTVCQMAPVALLTIVLDGTSHEATAGLMLAHEMVHVLGSDHDDQTAQPQNAVYQGKQVPCKMGFLMSPVATKELKTWSDCTRSQVDAEYARRGKTKPHLGNCFFT